MKLSRITLFFLYFLFFCGQVFGGEKKSEIELKKEIIEKNPLLIGFFPYREFALLSKMFTASALSPCGKYLAAGDKNGSVFVWNLNFGELLYTFNDHYFFSGKTKKLLSVGSIWFSFDSLEIFSLDERNTLVGRNLSSGELVVLEQKISHGSSSDINCDRVFSPSGTYAVRAGDTGFIIVDDLVKNSTRSIAMEHARCRLGSALFCGENYILTAPCFKRDEFHIDESCNDILMRDVRTGDIVDRLCCESLEELTLSLSENNHFLATIVLKQDYQTIILDKHHLGNSYFFDAQKISTIKVWRSFESLFVDQLEVLDKESRGVELTDQESELLQSIPVEAIKIVEKRVRGLYQSNCSQCLIF